MGVLVVVALFLVACLAALWVVARRDVTLCLLEVRGGRVEVAHGAIAPSVLSDIRDVVLRPVVARATVRVLRGKTHAQVETRGALTSMQAQQIRNIVGSVPLAKLRNGARA